VLGVPPVAADYNINPELIAGAQNGPVIVRIGYLVKDKGKRVLPVLQTV